MMHSGIVAGLSPPLERLMNGPMQEALEGKVKWESVDEGTFVCFWQYAYTGNYDICDDPTASSVDVDQKTTDLNEAEIPAGPTDIQVEESVHHGWDESIAPTVDAMPQPEPAAVSVGNSWGFGQPEPAEADDPWGFSNVKKDKKKRKGTQTPSKQERLWAKFTALRKTSDSPKLDHQARATHARSEAKHLLRHAKVCVFADCYGIIPLMTLSYNKLHQSLIDLTLHTQTLQGVVAVAQYCYETDIPDDLKELISLFIACKVEVLVVDKQFERLIKSHGEFGWSVLVPIVSRLE